METGRSRTAIRYERACRRRALRHSSDAELLSLLKRGNSDAFEILYARHSRDALRYARRLAFHSDHRTADDIVSEAVRRILTALEGGKGPVIGFREYLFTAVRSVSMTPTRPAHNDEAPDPLWVGDGPPVDEALERLVVMQAFTSLPVRWQRALWMANVTGETPIELGPRLGLSPNAVAALLKRAREALRVAYVRTHLPRPTNLACRRSIDRLARATVMPLAPGHQRSLDDHLDGCDECRAAAGAIRAEIASWSRSTAHDGAETNFRFGDSGDGVPAEGVA